MQSQSKLNSTVVNKKPLKKRVDYFKIFLSDTNKFELSIDGTSLIRTIYDKNGNMHKKYSYVKLNDPDAIRRIEESGNKWKDFDGDRSYGYIIRGQMESGTLNGYYKVVRSSRVKIRRDLWSDLITAIDSSIKDWTYYKRRKDY